MRTLYRAAAILTPDWPPATALVVDDATVAWVGSSQDVGVDAADRTVDLGEVLITPAFVDAHAHVSETGLLLRGIDLQPVRSVTALLDLVAAAARRGSVPVLGHGWDEARLAEGRPPTAAELDRAGGGVQVYLSRVDVHSAVISSALARACGAPDLEGWSPTGHVERDAHHAARDATRTALDPAARREIQLAALRAAAAAGIAAVHEMSAPHVAPEEDLRALVELTGADDATLPEVVAYRGQLVADEEEARTVLERLGVAVTGLAGDLCVDGSVGSHTAACTVPYADVPRHRGHLYLTVEQIRDHVAACTRVGVQAGFHAIGDAAVEAARQGFRRAAEQVGISRLRAARHRLEHVESIDVEGARDLADLCITASVQPAFDALWGGPDGMYATRLGARRALAMNPFATFVASRVPLALGSDSPVTPFDPWGAVRAAVHHHVPAQRLDVATAFAAHTAGGWAAAGVDGAGRLTAGAPATFAAWRLGGPVTSADAAAGALPVAVVEGPTPRCVLTVGRGRVLHDDR